jgi:hypothetical protein
MTIAITVKDQVHARPAEASLVLAWQSGMPMRLSDLIRERVRMEMERRTDATRVGGRPLVEMRAIASDSPAGDPDDPSSPTLERAVAVAFEGFHSNAFFVTIDGRQVTDLDAEIGIAPTTDITFVRLLPLVGG